MKLSLKNITILPMLLLFAWILVSLYFMDAAVQNSDRFGKLYAILLISNTILLFILTLAIVSRLLSLVIDMRRRVSGARLTWRLVLNFILVAIIPVGMVYAFSIKFLGSSIDSWFDVKVENSLDNALELSRLSFDFRVKELLLQSEDIAYELRDTPEVMVELSLNDYRKSVGAIEMTLLGSSNRIIASSGEENVMYVPNFPTEDILFILAQGKNYSGLESAGLDGFRIRTVVSLPSVGPLGGTNILTTLFPVSARMSDLADQVQQSYGEYGSLVYLRSPLKRSFIVTLFLVLLLSTLFAIWAAFAIARRMLSPIIELADATQAVSKGDYSRKIPVQQHDELGFLVQSFNEMTQRVDQARQAAELSQNVAEDQRSYLQAVLGNLSSGVLTIDASNNLRTVNDAVGVLLESNTSINRLIGRPFADLCELTSLSRSFCEQVETVMDESDGEWETEIHLFGEGGRKVLICRGIKLIAANDKENGQIIVVEDVTSMLATQRNAAWGEVARRLAHEIKNPLTPIQLSAERLEHKLQAELSRENQKILKRSTHTIVAQVEAMKSMVNEFRDYANPPEQVLRTCNLNELITSIVVMYRGYQSGVKLLLSLDKTIPDVDVDTGKIRQVLHNVIKNAFEAIKPPESATIELATRYIKSPGVSYIEVRVSDQGTGIPEKIQQDLFEPYVTDKQSGTGLGLAIVKKIIEEHGGTVTAINNKDTDNGTKGATITLRLPLRRTASKQLEREKTV